MKVFDFGSQDAGSVLFQMVDDHDLSFMEKEAELISLLAPDEPFRLIALKAADWNRDLSPWPAPPVFGKEGFGGGAKKTLESLLSEILSLPVIKDRKLYLGGYSLAGLFALWSAYQTDVFKGVAAASPSVWFPGFSDYAKGSLPKTKAVYLSLGNREEKTKNPVMARVGDAIRTISRSVEEKGIRSVLEWNEGNHFKEPELRTAKGFAWLLKG